MYTKTLPSPENVWYFLQYNIFIMRIFYGRILLPLCR